MDRTITTTGTYALWLKHWVKARAPWRGALVPAALAAGAGYAAKAYGRGRLKEINHQLLMGYRTPQTPVAEEAERFADFIVPGRCFADAIARMRAEQAEGRRVMLATASYEFYVLPIALKLRAEDVIGTRSQRRGGDILARIDGENCYGAAKLRMIEDYLAGRGFDRGESHVRFFSDHHTDAPTMEWADEAFAVNGTRKMRRLAKRHGWAQLSWH